VSPGYVADTAAVPVVVGVKVEVQVADAVVPANVHVVNDPVTPVWVRLTVPVGVVAPVVDVSVTVTVQVELWPTTTGLVQLTVVVVLCCGVAVTAMVNVPVLLE
jgi:hypothetical protein